MKAAAQIGACCSPFGGCSQTDAATCASQGNDFLGGPCVLNLCRGACCRPNGDCALNLPRVACEFNGGSFLGYGSNCEGANCPVLPNGACCGTAFCQVGFTPEACDGVGFYPGDDSTCQDCPGACCLKDDSCVDSTRGACEATKGAEFVGNLTTCPPEGCGDGACCLPTLDAGGLCTDGVNTFECALEFGTFQGPGSSCEMLTCAPFGGACCGGGGSSSDTTTASSTEQNSGGSCFFATREHCKIIPSQTFIGDGIACQEPFFCPGTGACCDPLLGTCQQLEALSCVQGGGQYVAAGMACDPNPCVPTKGACCLPSVTAGPGCVLKSEEECTDAGGVFSEVGEPCGAEGKCPPGPECGDGTCEPPTEDCLICPQDCPCTDGNACTEDFCDDAGECHSGPEDCDDFNPCTRDSCDPHVGCDNEAILNCSACCFPDRCMTVTNGFSQCNALGGVYQGHGTACEAGDICPGACCFANGTCEVRRPPECDVNVGDFQGEFTTCAESSCPVLGACCLFFGDLPCDHTSREDCPGGFNGTYLGEGTRCPVNPPPDRSSCGCMTNADCDDENPCNGKEACVGGSCRTVPSRAAGLPTCGNGDFDDNGELDLGDHADLIPCLAMGGPGVPAGQSCAPGDRDGDGAVDLVDIWYMQRRPFVCNTRQCRVPVAGQCQDRCLGNEVCDGAGNCIPK